MRKTGRHASAEAMTIRERVRAALHMEPVDQVPFTAYHGMVPCGETERTLRALGLGISQRVGLLRSSTPNVRTERVEYEEQGVRFCRTIVRTPVGEVSATQRLGAAYGSSWYVDHYIKRPDDYRTVQFMVDDTVYEPDYESYPAAVENLGEDGYVSGNFGYTPLMEMRVHLLGLERFAFDMFDRPDLFFALYETLRDKQRSAYPILADSPAELIIYGGNSSPEVLGKQFARCCVPCYDELGAMLRDRGKLLGSHLDANNAFWAKEVACSSLDVIEAFTPAPDTDMSLADARAAWPDKVLWINYPSSLHLSSAEEIRAATGRMLREVGVREGLIFGITENIPEHAWRTSLRAIAEALAAIGA